MVELLRVLMTERYVTLIASPAAENLVGLALFVLNAGAKITALCSVHPIVPRVLLISSN